MLVTLITNTDKDISLKYTKLAEEILRAAGTDVYKLQDSYDIPEGTSYVITLGGDGTLLHAASKAAEMGIPILGVNLGTLGYLTELETSEIEKISYLLGNDFKIDERMMLTVNLYRDNKLIYSEDALNDAVIAHGEILRVIPLGLFCDGEEIKTFRGDGIIICSPTGSTAYSLSAGGPVVDPLSDCITVTPLSAHALYAKSFVFSGNRRIEVAVGELENRSAYLSADGRTAILLASCDRIEIQRSSLKTKFIKMKDYSFLKILYQKL